MTNNFEEKKSFLYIANGLSYKKYVKRNIENIARWIIDDGQKICEHQLLNTKKEYNADDFVKFFSKNYTAGFNSIFEYASKLRKKYRISSQSKPSSFEKNLHYLQKLFNLSNDEIEFLGFIIRTTCNEYWSDILSDLQRRCSNLKFEEQAMFAGIKPHKVHAICNKNSSLVNFGLIEIDYDGKAEASSLSKNIYYQKFHSVEDLRSYILGKPIKANLQWSDFKHIENVENVKKILQKSLNNNEKGINILLYGEPGTGKTEFAKALVNHIGGHLYSIGEDTNSDLVTDDEHSRFRQLIRANTLLDKSKESCILVDEADDILTDCHSSHYWYSRKDNEVTKIKVNRTLENNTTPTIWISNNIHSMDKAYLRRFTYAINFTRPNKPVLEEMWQKSLKANKLPCDERTVKEFATKYSLSPSFITTATKSAKLIKGGIKEVEQTLDALQEAYNNGKKPKNDIVVPKTQFNPKLLNTDTDLNNLAKQITNLGKLNFSLCLYGVSGTGKSAFAQYLGEQMGIPVIKKRCSDLLSMWIGEAEKNIAAAFEEAKQKGALLIFDEADSFLQDRSGAQRSWEVTQVNEMLTQMEKATHPFVCTTNLMDKLDKASLRRFTFKVKYDYMTEEQRNLCFEHFFNIKDVDLSHLPSLTPGDFVVVKDKAEILGFMDNKEELLKMLEMEQQNKAPVSKKIGFI
ncbi:MAG: AAA family ATPase [Alphaproteobacteria bacterium]|nr:AAA family ATPase [Alphaproteobacteria bacterium]